MTRRERVAIALLGTGLGGQSLPGTARAHHPGLGAEEPLALLAFLLVGLWMFTPLTASVPRERRKRPRQKTGWSPRR